MGPSVTKEGVRLLKEKEVDGYVNHVNSIAGHFVPPCIASQINVYPASKNAVTALVEVDVRYN